MEWINVHDNPPKEGVVVETMISDHDGERNQAKLRRSGRLWFLPSGDVYVYYTPTHWRTP